MAVRQRDVSNSLRLSDVQETLLTPQIAGRITSIAPRSTLGHPVAMAFVRPDLAEPGTHVQIRRDDGTMATAQVATLPFYDPQNNRQQ